MAHSIVWTCSYVDSGNKWSPGVPLHEIELAGEREREGDGWGREVVRSIVQTCSYVDSGKKWSPGVPLHGEGRGTFYSTDPQLHKTRVRTGVQV